MTGRHTGSTDIDLTLTSGKPNSEGGYPSFEGSATTTYDGTTVTAPYKGLGSVARCKGRSVPVPKLKATAKSLGKGRYAIKVTAKVAGAGANEAAVDTRAVKRATVKAGGKRARTNNRGIAVITTGAKQTKVKVSAGDTLVPTSVTVGKSGACAQGGSRSKGPPWQPRCVDVGATARRRSAPRASAD